MAAGWQELGDAATAAEGAALAKVRSLLPDDGITHAWSSLSFIDLNTQTAEVDLLLMTKSGFYVVELKGWHGRITGDQQNWRVTAPNGAVRTTRNPLYATDLKAKRLASLLKRLAPNDRARRDVPFIQALVVLHGEGSRVDLDDIAQSSLVALDGYSVKGLNRSLSDVLRTPPASMDRQISGPRATAIKHLLRNVGFTPTPKTRMVGQYSLEKADPIGQGPSWQDLLASHPNVPSIKRRVRIFNIPKGASEEARTEIERAARRAFVLTQGIEHEGITRALEFVLEPSPALIYDHSPTQVPLTDYLAEHGASLDLSDRLDLIRGLAGILRYAHQRRLVHRALTPRQVYVETAADPVRLLVRDWQSARLDPGTSTTTSSLSLTSFGTRDVRTHVGESDWIYLAPEAYHEASGLPSMPLDVYGLGAITYLLLTGNAPASNLAELQERLESDGALDPQVADPTVDDSLAALVQEATRRTESDRTASVDEFLTALDAAEDALTAPSPEAPPEERPRASDPLSAGRGEIIADRFEVKEHRGQGSTGTALLVDDYIGSREGVILKIARDDGAVRRLQEEAEVLAQVDHPRIVRLLEPPLEVDGRHALLLSDAGKETLAGRLDAKGRATLQELERFGTDLLEAVAHLDSLGLFHRDLKPANLGIRPDPSTRQPRLVLFDLSLAREPVDNITSGTRGYVDPYLGLASGKAKRRRYDRAAEHYAAAVTLFEMATKGLPWWADGGLSPASPTDTVVLEPGLFEDSVGESLFAFFTHALAPTPADRFGDLASMAKAWQEVFTAVDPAGEEHADEALANAAAAATLDTPLADAGLSARALSGLGRLDVATVGDLLRTSPVAVNAIAGLGEQNRKEVQRRIREWRSRLQTAPASVRPEAQLEGDRSIERYLQSLVPRASKNNASEVATLRLILSSPPPPGVEVPAHDLGPWPSMNQVATVVGVTSGRVSQIVEKAASRWIKRDEITVVQEELVEALDADEGVASLTELAAALLLRHGSTAEGAERQLRAAGLVRATVEADRRSPEPRFVTRRPRGHGAILIALNEFGQQEAGEPLLAHAAQLGEAVAKIVKEKDVVPASIARVQLKSVPTQGPRLSDDRLLRLAARASDDVLLSSLHELYRADLPPITAMAIALRSAAGASLTEAGVRKRVAQRFPALPDLPPRPELDKLVAAAVSGLRWDGTGYTRATAADSSATATRVTNFATERTDVVDDYLRGSLARNSALTLSAHPRIYAHAQKTLQELYGVKAVDLSQRMVRAVRNIAEQEEVDWSLVLESDAKEAGGDKENLVELVQDALEPVWKEILTDPEPLLLINAAPLTRYGLTSKLSTLLDQSRPRPAARWLLVPRWGHQQAPTLDGHDIPFGADRWIDLPNDLATPGSGVSA